MSRSSIPRKMRDAVFERDRGRCQYCRLAQFGHGAMFHIDHILESGECLGLTPIGRATVAALQMNGVIPRFARVCQIRLGLLSAT